MFLILVWVWWVIFNGWVYFEIILVSDYIWVEGIVNLYLFKKLCFVWCLLWFDFLVLGVLNDENVMCVWIGNGFVVGFWFDWLILVVGWCCFKSIVGWVCGFEKLDERCVGIFVLGRGLLVYLRVLCCFVEYVGVWSNIRLWFRLLFELNCWVVKKLLVMFV